MFASPSVDEEPKCKEANECLSEVTQLETHSRAGNPGLHAHLGAGTTLRRQLTRRCTEACGTEASPWGAAQQLLPPHRAGRAGSTSVTAGPGFCSPSNLL